MKFVYRHGAVSPDNVRRPRNAMVAATQRARENVRHACVRFVETALRPNPHLHTKSPPPPVIIRNLEFDFDPFTPPLPTPNLDIAHPQNRMTIIIHARARKRPDSVARR